MHRRIPDYDVIQKFKSESSQVYRGWHKRLRPNFFKKAQIWETIDIYQLFCGFDFRTNSKTDGRERGPILKFLLYKKHAIFSVFLNCI